MDVAGWLRALGLERYVAAFRTHDITAAVLPNLSADDLNDLGITTMRLMTNNPVKYGGLEGFGLDITERVPLQPSPNPENIAYLRTKRERMGHILHGLDDVL